MKQTRRGRGTISLVGKKSVTGAEEEKFTGEEPVKEESTIRRSGMKTRKRGNNPCGGVEGEKGGKVQKHGGSVKIGGEKVGGRRYAREREDVKKVVDGCPFCGL